MPAARTMTVALFALFVAALLGGCGGSNIPMCALIAPTHTTQDGVVQVGQSLLGDRVEDVVELATTAVDAAPGSGLTVLYETSCDDPDCTPTIDCGPATLDPGDDIACAVEDEIDAVDCAWSCQISVVVTILDDEVCRDALEVVEVAGQHVAPVAGR